MSDLTVARELFASVDLPFPEVPDPLMTDLLRRGEWWFSTLSNGAPPYALDAYVREFVSGGEGDYLVLAHDGHGASSWALHYYVVLGPVGVFTQSAWGGAYATDEDDREERDAIRYRFAQVSELLTAVDGGATLGADRRLAAVVTDLGPNRWAIIEPGNAPRWQETRDPLGEACSWLVNET